MIVPLAKLTSATFMVVSKRPIMIRYHWVGRSVMCAGRDCPACLLRTSKSIYYFAATFQKENRVIEACPSMVNAIERLAETLCLENWNGIAVEARRTNNRCPWVFAKTGYFHQQSSIVPEVEVVAAIADLYRLSPPGANETGLTWVNRVAPSQREVLAKCQLV